MLYQDDHQGPSGGLSAWTVLPQCKHYAMGTPTLQHAFHTHTLRKGTKTPLLTQTKGGKGTPLELLYSALHFSYKIHGREAR